MPVEEYENYRKYLRGLSDKALQQEFCQQTDMLYLTMIQREAVLRRVHLQGNLPK